MRPASQNPYPIYDQNLRFSLPFLRPNQIYNLTLKSIPCNRPALVQTNVKGNVYLLLLGRLQDFICKEVASSKKKTNSILECKNRYAIYYRNGSKMAIIDTLFMTKIAEKSYPLGPHIPI